MMPGGAGELVDVDAGERVAPAVEVVEPAPPRRRYALRRAQAAGRLFDLPGAVS